MKNKEFFIKYDGLNVHVKLDFPEQEQEKYPLVILIHGFTGHMEEPHILAIASAMNEIGYAVLRADMYGHGQSDGAFCDHTLYKWIDCSLAVIDYAKTLDFVSDFYLCGHSQGGLLTTLLGALEKDLFQAIIPLSPAYSIPEGARKGDLLGYHFDPQHIPDSVRMNDGRILKGNYARVAQMIDVDKAIEQYHGPVLLVHGSADATVPVDCSCQAAQKYENATLVLIPDDTHCYDRHLDLVTDAIQKFLS